MWASRNPLIGYECAPSLFQAAVPPSQIGPICATQPMTAEEALAVHSGYRLRLRPSHGGCPVARLSGLHVWPRCRVAAYPLTLAGLGCALAVGQHRLAAAEDEPRPAGDRPAVVDGVLRP